MIREYRCEQESATREPQQIEHLIVNNQNQLAPQALLYRPEPLQRVIRLEARHT